MVTPQEIQEKTFTKAVFGGYDMASVDDYLEEISGDFAALGKENAILKGKIKVLVEKVEEYRSTEDAMRMALLTAQKTRDEIIADANSKKDKIMTEAEAVGAEKIAQIRQEIREEELKLAAAKQETARFVEAARMLCEGQVGFLEKLEELELPDLRELRRTTPLASPAATFRPEPQPAREQQAAPAAIDQIEDTAASISESMRRMESQTGEEAGANAPAPVFDDDRDSLFQRQPEPQEVPPEFAAVENEFAAQRQAERKMSEETSRTKLFKKLSNEEIWDDDEPTSPRPKFNFNDLKFGANYDTKDE